MTESIPEEAFETILHRAVIRPAGRQFRGEPARQVEILRLLRQAARPVPFDDLHAQLKLRGVVRSAREDDAARRKGISQAVEAINDKLGRFFFQVDDPRLLEEMFRIQVHSEEPSRPAYSLQDFCEVRKLSGVRFYATTQEPAGGVTRELFELVTEIRPKRLDMMAPSLESLFGNPEFRGMLTRNLHQPDARARLLLLDPGSAASEALEAQELKESPLSGRLRDRIRATISHVDEIRGALPVAARHRFEARLAGEAPLWRFRMVFLPEVLHLRLFSPGATGETLIKLGASSALYTTLHDVFERQWQAASDRPGE